MWECVAHSTKSVIQKNHEKLDFHKKQVSCFTETSRARIPYPRIPSTRGNGSVGWLPGQGRVQKRSSRHREPVTAGQPASCLRRSQAPQPPHPSPVPGSGFWPQGPPRGPRSGRQPWRVMWGWDHSHWVIIKEFWIFRFNLQRMRSCLAVVIFLRFCPIIMRNKLRYYHGHLVYRQLKAKQWKNWLSPHQWFMCFTQGRWK